jgi:hypothetical protein
MDSPRDGAPPPRLLFLLRLAAVATLLTNAYYLRFLEPWVSRGLLGAIVVVAGLLSFLPLPALPRTPAAAARLIREAAVPLTLVGILAVGFFLREWGSHTGLPQSYLADEIDWVNRALQMIKRGDFNPEWWHHPTLQRYATALAYVVVFFVGVAQGRWHQLADVSDLDMIYWGRFVSVLGGTAAIAVTFFLARRLFGNGCALLAAALLAVFPGAVRNAQYNKPDTLTGLLVVIGVVLALDYLERGTGRRAFAAGLLAGLAAAAKYNAAEVLLAFVVAVLVRRGARTLAAPDLYLGALGAGAGFFLGSPYFLADLPRFLDHVADEVYIYGIAGREGVVGVDNWWNHAVYLFLVGVTPLALVTSVGGLTHLLYRLGEARAVFLVFPIVYYSHYSAQKIRLEATLVPLYPFFAILAAYGALTAVRWGAERWPSLRRDWVLPTVALVLVSYPLARSLRYDYLATRKDTGTYAREWIEANLPAGTHFALERYCPILDRERYKVTQESHVIKKPLEFYRDQGVQYLMVTHFSYARYGPEHPQTRAYQKLFEACPLVREFGAEKGPGPTMRLLALPPTGAPGEVSSPPPSS